MEAWSSLECTARSDCSSCRRPSELRYRGAQQQQRLWELHILKPALQEVWQGGRDESRLSAGALPSPRACG